MFRERERNRNFDERHHPHHERHHDEDEFFFIGFGGPFFFGLWGFDYGPYAAYSPYYYYGLPYVYAPSVYTTPQPAYSYSNVSPYYYGGPAYTGGLSAALDDIKNGWMNKNSDLILSHIATDRSIPFYLNGNYSYTVEANDYANMTRDAITRVRTVDFSWYKLEQRSDGAYVAFARHQFYDINGNLKTAYVSYTLQQVDNTWIVVATGSSASRL